MNSQNILKYYGSKLDVKLDTSELYDYELAKVDDDYYSDVLDLDNLITYTGLTLDTSMSEFGYVRDNVILTEYDNSVNDPLYPYSGYTVFLNYNDFVNHFSNTYLNTILNNHVYTYTNPSGETHYFTISAFTEDVQLNLNALITPGSIVVNYYLLSNRILNESVTVSFTHKLYTTGGTIDVITGITINAGESESSLTYVFNENYDSLTKETEFTDVVLPEGIPYTGFKSENETIFIDPTPTPTPTNTPTPTPTPTNTPTSTPTSTPTNTPTSTPTGTPTNTPTPTPTGNPTNTPTSTPTLTPTNTPIPPTSTPTPTPTNTPTATPTSTPTATPTPDTPTPPPLEPQILYKIDVNNPLSYSGTGNSINDLVYTATTTVYNSPIYSSDYCVNYLEFDGESNYGFVNNISQLFVGEEISVFTWINPISNGVILNELSNGLNGDWHSSIIELVSNYLFFGLWNGTNIESIAYEYEIKFNDWVYVGFTYDGNELIGYVDATEVVRININREKPPYFQLGIGLLDIVNMGDGSPGNFKIGTIEVWDRAISSGLVSGNYNTYLPTYICPTPTPTNTPTPTPTPTNTPIPPTSTPTPTPTNTPIPPTSTPTPTPTNTPTPSPTPTRTPTPTPTPTNTPTPTPTPPTNTPTPTPTPECPTDLLRFNFGLGSDDSEITDVLSPNSFIDTLITGSFPLNNTTKLIESTHYGDNNENLIISYKGDSVVDKHCVVSVNCGEIGIFNMYANSLFGSFILDRRTIQTTDYITFEVRDGLHQFNDTGRLIISNNADRDAVNQLLITAIYGVTPTLLDGSNVFPLGPRECIIATHNSNGIDTISIDVENIEKREYLAKLYLNGTLQDTVTIIENSTSNYSFLHSGFEIEATIEIVIVSL
jgi:hypothetical protein